MTACGLPVHSTAHTRHRQLRAVGVTRGLLAARGIFANDDTWPDYITCSGTVMSLNNERPITCFRRNGINDSIILYTLYTTIEHVMQHCLSNGRNHKTLSFVSVGVSLIFSLSHSRSIKVIETTPLSGACVNLHCISSSVSRTVFRHSARPSVL